jgi:type I restriction enzyme, S subunit
MIEGLKPYPEYKESGLPWITKTPAHWWVNRLRHACEMLVSNVDKHTKPNELPVFLCNYVDVYKNERIHSRLRFMRATASKDELARFHLRHGDVVITKDSEDWKDIGVPALVEHEAPDFVCGYHLAILRPRPAFVSGAFLLRTLQCHLVAAQFYVEAHGVTRYGLGHSAIKDVIVPIPPPDEQAAIVLFLDYANRKIDGFIRAKRKLIGLLNEQKQAIIHRAVTRGLQPDVPLKPSGIPWLGDIPKHWGIVRNMALFAHRVEPGLAGLPVLQVSLRSGITAEELDQFGRPKRLIADATKYKRIHEGDMAYNTMRMWQGAVGVSPSDGLVSPAYVVLKPRKDTCPEFYDFIFHTEVYKQQVNRQSTGIVSDRNRLYWDSFKQMPNLTLPPTEQKEIVAFIAQETAALTAAIARTEREIALMQEYRTRLTADLVTGKLDVREAAAHLPEPPAEPATEEVLEDFADECEPDENPPP